MPASSHKENIAAPATPNVVYHLLRQAAFEQSLLFMQNVLGRKGTLIDLGAGHCAFSRMAHAMGWKVTALDVRSERVPELPPEINFIHSDLNSQLWDPADYDLILCLGVYYHLDQQMQHGLLWRCAGKPMIIDTHFANPPGAPTRYGRALGLTHERNGEMGADYREAAHQDDNTRKSANLRASYDNPTSWWQTKESLLKTIHEHGWPHVWTLDYDGLDFVQRSFFICHTIDDRGPGITGIRV